MHFLIMLILVLILIGALAGGNSFGEMIREGCGTLIGGVIFIFIVIWLLVSGSSNDKSSNNVSSSSAPSSSIQTEQYQPVLTEKLSQSNGYTDNNGKNYTYYINENGAVLESNSITLYIGKDCDTYATDYGVGNWYYDTSGFFIQVGELKVQFPGQQLNAGSGKLCQK